MNNRETNTGGLLTFGGGGRKNEISSQTALLSRVTGFLQDNKSNDTQE
jgi:hypothetical protein